jgi:hypothetical protein
MKGIMQMLKIQMYCQIPVGQMNFLNKKIGQSPFISEIDRRDACPTAM